MKSIILGLLLISTLFSATFTLKCVNSNGTKVPDILVDLQKKTIKGGMAVYDIVALDDTYIVAYQRTNPLVSAGGEVLMINRLTGDFRRAYVGEMFTAGEDPKTAKLDAGIVEGKCYKQQF